MVGIWRGAVGHDGIPAQRLSEQPKQATNNDDDPLMITNDDQEGLRNKHPER